MTAPTIDVAPRVAELHQELDRATAMIEDFEAELRGQPISWTTDLPHEQTEAGFKNAIVDVLAECGAGFELVLVACDERPCIAVFRNTGENGDRWAQITRDCLPWRDRYGPEPVLAAPMSAMCPDGPRSLYVFAARAGLPDGDNAARRFEFRAEALDLCAIPKR